MGGGEGVQELQSTEVGAGENEAAATSGGGGEARIEWPGLVWHISGRSGARVDVEAAQRSRGRRRSRSRAVALSSLSPLQRSGDLTSRGFTSEDNQQLDVGSCRSGQRPSRARTNSEGSAGMTARSTVSAPPPPMGAYHFHSLQKIEGGGREREEKRRRAVEMLGGGKKNVRPQCGSKERERERKIQLIKASGSLCV